MTEEDYMNATNAANIRGAVNLMNQVHESPLPVADALKFRKLKTELFMLADRMQGLVKTTQEKPFKIHVPNGKESEEAGEITIRVFVDEDGDEIVSPESLRLIDEAGKIARKVRGDSISKEDIEGAIQGAFWNFERTGYSNEEFIKEVLEQL